MSVIFWLLICWNRMQKRLSEHWKWPVSRRPLCWQEMPNVLRTKWRRIWGLMKYTVNYSRVIRLLWWKNCCHRRMRKRNWPLWVTVLMMHRYFQEQISVLRWVLWDLMQPLKQRILFWWMMIRWRLPRLSGLPGSVWELFMRIFILPSVLKSFVWFSVPWVLPTCGLRFLRM